MQTIFFGNLLHFKFENQHFSEVSSPLTPHFEACDDHFELLKLPWVCIQLLESSSGADAVIRPGDVGMPIFVQDAPVSPSVHRVEPTDELCPPFPSKMPRCLPQCSGSLCDELCPPFPSCPATSRSTSAQDHRDRHRPTKPFTIVLCNF